MQDTQAHKKKVYSRPIAHFTPNTTQISIDSLATMSDKELLSFYNQCKETENAKIYQVNPDLIERRIGDEWILVPVGKLAQNFNGMITLNKFSRFLWEQFKQPTSLKDAIHAATERFDGNTSITELEVRQFIDDAIISQILNEIQQNV
ncbi:MAG: PqqD family protein [Phocaeicola sp.]|uniref:PqqD family protein n=1 Tax=Phocaeicola TaxID=909656 RepID=UPI00234EE570|nr:PqqD family protein [Phocaeicola oris]MCE2616811.1 PqqD family protein [Phocaeicola oris]